MILLRFLVESMIWCLLISDLFTICLSSHISIKEEVNLFEGYDDYVMST